MRTKRTVPRTARLLIGTMLLSTLSCTKPLPINIDDSQLTKQKVLHVKLKSGENYIMREPRLMNQYLFGKIWIDDMRTKEKEIKISLADIQSIKSERYSLTQTIIVGTVCVVVAAGMLFLISVGAALGQLR